MENKGCCTDGEVTPSSSTNVDKPDNDEEGEEENVVFTSNGKEGVVRNVGTEYSGMCEEEQMNLRNEAEVDVDVRNEVVGTTEDKNVTGMREECVFARGGMCKTHQRMSKKVVIPSLKWRKDKFGNFKYMRSQTTKYICEVKNTPLRKNSVTAELEFGNNQRLRDNTSSGPSEGLQNRSGDLPDILKERVSRD